MENIPKALQVYQTRINAVIDYIVRNLDKSFSLEELAAVAYFSPYHFHRIFVAILGESVNFYTNRARLEKAARLLKFSKNTISDITYDCGFSSPSTFSRSFKQYFTTSPSTFRKKGNLKNSKICKELFPITEYLVPMSLVEKQQRFPIKIKTFPQRKVAYIRVINSYREGVVIRTFERLIEWAKQHNLFKGGQFFGMSLDDPMVTPKEKYRYEVCMTIPSYVDCEDADGIETMVMPLCQYATTVISGNINIVATAISYLFNDWLINSAYEPAHQYGLELFLDKAAICDWTHFDIELCVPVQPLKGY
ncbi:MAG: GyrI-like domain-containing protein [Bacteroidota bacterium]